MPYPPTFVVLYMYSLQPRALSLLILIMRMCKLSHVIPLALCNLVESQSNDIYHYDMTKCITFIIKLFIDVYLTEIPHKYALLTYFS